MICQCDTRVFPARPSYQKGFPAFWHVADAIAVPDTLSCHPETHWEVSLRA